MSNNQGQNKGANQISARPEAGPSETVEISSPQPTSPAPEKPGCSQKEQTAKPKMSFPAAIRATAIAFAPWLEPIINWFIQEWIEMRAARYSILVIALIVGGISWSITSCVYEKHITSLNNDNARYRHMLDIEDIPGKTTMMELTNRELKERAMRNIKRIRAMIDHYGTMSTELSDQHKENKITHQQYADRWSALNNKFGKEYDATVRVDAQMTLRELRNRIPYERRKHIVGLPELTPADPRAGSVDIQTIIPGDFATMTSGLMSREMEELVKLLKD